MRINKRHIGGSKLRKKFAIVFIIIIAMSIALLFYYNKEDSNERTIAGCKYEYTYFDRKLTVDDFRQFGYDSTYEEIVEAVGEENGNIGSGLYIPYYELRGGKYAIIHFSSNVRRIDIANRFKVLYSLLPVRVPYKEADQKENELLEAKQYEMNIILDLLRIKEWVEPELWWQLF